MRQIGTITEERSARRLVDYLLTLGVTAQVRKEADGWGLWVLDENRVPLARVEFDAYRQAPDDPRFEAAPREAETIRREAGRIDARYRKNIRDASQTWGRTPFRRRPLTIIMVAISVVVFVLQNVHERRRGALDTSLKVTDKLAFASTLPKVDDQGHRRPDPMGIEDIAGGEVWRLVTPIFMHANVLHIVFNLWLLITFGTLIEARRGTWMFAALVLFAAVASNVGQHIYNIRVAGEPRLFLGMSGVGYALFGYLWMKGLHEPEPGMVLHSGTVQTMLFWLVLCMTGAIGPVANAAHVVGMVVGMLFGLARF